MAPKARLKGVAATLKSKRTRNISARPESSSAPPDPNTTARGSRCQNRQGVASEAEVSFLRDRVAYLNGKLAEYKDIVAKLTHEIRAEDGVYKKKYNAKRRQMNRIKKKLEENKIYIDGVGTEEAEEKVVASSLMELANEATEFLAREIEGDAAEGTTMEANAAEQAATWMAMEVDVAEQAAAQAAAEAVANAEAEATEEAAAAEAVAEFAAAPGAVPPSDAAHVPNGEAAIPILDILRGNPFSPLAELGMDAIEEPPQSQPGSDHPLEPMHDGDIPMRGSRRTPAFRDRQKRGLTSPFDRSTPPKRAPLTSLPPLPQPPTAPDAYAQTDRQQVASKQVQTEENRVPQRHEQCQTKGVVISMKSRSRNLPAQNAIPRKWINGKAKKLIGFISDHVVGDSSWTEDGGIGVQHVNAVLGKLFTRHPVVLAGVLQNIGDKHTVLKEMKAEVESAVCDQIQDHLDLIAGPLYSLLNLTEREYQKLINALSWEYDYEQGKHRRIRFKWGSKMPRFMSYIKLREAKRQFMETLGMVREENRAYVDAETVLVRRIRTLVKQGILVLHSGMKLRVQLLGDATGIWKSLKVNGTTVVLKIMYDVPHGAKKEGSGCNSKTNMIPIGFYLGDDCLKDMQQYMPHLPAMLQKLQDEGVTIDDTKLDVEFWLGGDLKFVTAMFGMSGNSSSNPCPLCKASHSKKCRQLHLTKAELQKGKVDARTVAEIQELAHLYLGRNVKCRACSKQITKDITHPQRTTHGRQSWQKKHFMVKEGEGPFLPFIPVSRVLVDILHLELRICPVLWRLTVSNHVDKKKLQAICQWVSDKHKVIISKGTAVQSSTGMTNKIGSNSWPGRTCAKIMQIYPEVMAKVHVSNGQNKKVCIKCWEYFVVLMHTLKQGCNDSDPEAVTKHADAVGALAEKLIQACIDAGLGMDRVTVYMHIAQAHLGEQIKLIGSMSKGSSQGAEFLHQDTQDLSRRHTNKSRMHTCGTTLQKSLCKQEASQKPDFGHRKGKGQESLPGGHLSKADREVRHQKYEKILEKRGQKMFEKEEEAEDSEDSESSTSSSSSSFSSSTIVDTSEVDTNGSDTEEEEEEEENESDD